jgi:hypothetical protein
MASRAASVLHAVLRGKALTPVPTSSRSHLSFGASFRSDRRITLDAYTWPVELGPAGMAFVDVQIAVPAFAFALVAAEELTFRLASALLPWHGRVHTPGSSLAVCHQRAASSTSLPIAPPFGLPALRNSPRRRHPLVPLDVAWINLWSADSCALLGFTAGDHGLFESVRPTADGAQVLAVTSTPLDPTRHPEHARALRAVYARFPRIGCRDRP